MTTTRYIIARDAAGTIIAKRSTLGHHDYKFATRRGTFHSRRDLVPAGQEAFPVVEITAAEFRALAKAETDSVERLGSMLMRAEANVAGWRRTVMTQEHRLTLDVATLPTREVENRYSSGTRTEVLVGDEWLPAWMMERERLQAELDRNRRSLINAEKSTENTRKRLIAAQRREAKEQGR